MHRRNRNCLIAALAFFISSILSTSTLVQADLVWNGSTDSIWSDSSNWTATGGDTAPPGTGDTAIFNNAGNGNTTISLSAVVVGRININTASAASYTFGSGGAGVETLNLDPGGAGLGIDVQSTVTTNQLVDAKLVVTGAANTVEFANNSASSTITFAGGFDNGAGSSGTHTLRFIGVGSTVISGDIADTGGAGQTNLEVRSNDLTLSGNVLNGATTIRNNGSAKLTVTSSGSLTSSRQLNIERGQVILENDQTMTSNTVFGQATRADSDATLTINGTKFEFGGGVIRYVADDTIANLATINGTGNLQLTGGGRNFDINDNANVAGAEMTITNNITNDGTNRNLVKRLDGTLLLTGANTHGQTIVEGGTLQLGNDDALFATQALQVRARNVASSTASSTLDIAGFDVTATGLTIGNANTGTYGASGHTSDIIDSVGTGSLTINNITYRAGSAGFLNGQSTVSTDISLTGNRVYTVEDGNDATDLVISGDITATVATNDITVRGDGTLELSGSNTYDRLTIESSNVKLGSGDAVGTGRVLVFQRNFAAATTGSVLDINGQTVTLGENLVVSQFSTNNVVTAASSSVIDSAGGGQINLGGTLTYNTGSVTSNLMSTISANVGLGGATRTFDILDGADDIDLDISGAIVDDGTHNINKNGAGTVRLSGTGSYNSLFVNNGRAIITSAAALGDNNIRLGGGATGGFNTFDGVLEYTGTGDSIGNRIQIGSQETAAASNVLDTGSGTIVNNGTGAITFTNTLFNTQDVDTLAERSFAFGGTNIGLNEVQGTIRDHSTNAAAPVLNIAKEDTGTWVFSGDNTYTGTTAINLGTLVINGDQSAATGDVTVASGATLAGTGTIGGATTVSGTHAVGQSAGIQTFASNVDLTYMAGANVEWELLANTELTGDRGSLFDGIDMNAGMLTFDGGLAGSLDLIFDSPGSTVTDNGFWFTDRQWRVIDGAGSIVGMFANLNVGAGAPTPGIFSLDYSSGDSVVLNWTTTIPEPTAFMMFSLGLATIGLGRRRKRAKA